MNKITENIDVYLKLKKSSWENFFRVMNNRKDSIQLVNGSSLGNFWAAVQHLEQQFKDYIKCYKCPQCGTIKILTGDDAQADWLSLRCEKCREFIDFEQWKEV